MPITEDQAGALIDYMEELSTRSNHQAVMAAMEEQGYSEKELDEACRALGMVARRDFRIV